MTGRHLWGSFPKILLGSILSQDVKKMSENIQEKSTLVTPVKERRDRVFFKVKALKLKAFLTLQKTQSNEAKMVFDVAGISCSSVDPCHVSMISTELRSKGIEAYTFLSGSEKLELGIDVDKFLGILKTVKKEDTVTFDYDTDKELTKIFVTVGAFVHTVGIIDASSMPDPKQPHLELPACFVIETNLFYEFIKKAGDVSDNLGITTETEKLTLFAKGETDEVNLVKLRGQLPILESNSNHTSLFSVDYLLNIMVNLKKMFKYVEVRIGSDNPVQLKCSDENGETVTVLIAPRIESE
jgi:hypothetical protein